MNKAESKRQFDNEIQVLKVIKRLQSSKGKSPRNVSLIWSVGFPRLLTHGYLEDKQMNYMVITKFDADLEYIFT